MIHAWLLPVPASAPDLVAVVEPRLAPWERERLARFSFDRDRALYAAAHGLIRMALSARYPSVPIDRWELDRTPAGKPIVRAPVSGPLEVSLSHTRGLVACAVAPMPVGIDVEAVDSGLDVGPLLERVLSPAERATWPSDPDVGRFRFFRTWAVKEALLKGLGLGLGCEPNTVTIASDDPERPAVVAIPADVGSAADWWITALGMSADHVGAVAGRGPGAATVTRHQVEPEVFLRALRN